MLLLDNQSTFDLCCNKAFATKIIKAVNALKMMSNGSGLKITEECKILGYRYLVCYSKKAITNFIFLKNLIKFYQETLDSEVDTKFVVHLICLIYCLKCTLAVCTHATPKRWVSLVLSKLCRITCQ
jgi:hypothetical protein